jgi:hypothetical protein
METKSPFIASLTKFLTHCPLSTSKLSSLAMKHLQALAPHLVKVLLFLAISAFPLQAAEYTEKSLAQIEAELKVSPEDPMLHYRKCQALFAQGKEDEAITHAAVAFEKFKAAKSRLAWMKIGTIKTEKHRIDVHYNMGEQERGGISSIVRPYSFRVWTTDAEPKLVRVIDFELGYSGGKVVTGAIGETTRDGTHINYGPADEKTTFATVKQKVLAILKH